VEVAFYTKIENLRFGPRREPKRKNFLGYFFLLNISEYLLRLCCYEIGIILHKYGIKLYRIITKS
jgi:predicted CDP-diglyceride synthetase/phosphatidate cytidylyltransferase